MSPFPAHEAEVANKEKEDLLFKRETCTNHLVHATKVSDLVVLQCFNLLWDKEDDPPPGLIHDEDD